LAENELPSNILQNGVDNTDLVIIVSAINNATTSDGTVVDFCKTAVLASAFTCATDQFDRPIIGFINFCLGNSTSISSQGQRRRGVRRTSSNGPQQRRSNRHRRTSILGNDDEVKVVLHELGHVLGMSSQHFPYFRNATTGEPLTSRPIPLQHVTCTGGDIQYIPFAANNTLQMGVTDKGLIYYDVVTPRVQQVTRNHFNCPSLNGARLEDHDTNPSDCTGSHWDERLFFGELMEPVVLPGSLVTLSPLTLALMEDTGWYRVDYSNVSSIAFGQGAGCGFVNGDCIVNNTVPDYGKDFFCSSITPFLPDGHLTLNGTDVFCDPLHYEWTLCNLFDTQQAPAFFVNEVAPGGVDVHYFSNPNLVGLSPQGDYCPIPNVPLMIDCTDGTTEQIVDYQGEQYGSTSRCINVQYDSATFGRTINRPGCFETTCDTQAYKVVVNGLTCDYDFQELTIFTTNSIPVTMICPRLSTICPDLTACPADCSGRGTCNSNKRPPTCECFDSSDTTSDCSSQTTVSNEVGSITSESTPSPQQQTSSASSSSRRLVAGRAQRWISAVMGATLLLAGACLL
jgi:hypothetical protein